MRIKATFSCEVIYAPNPRKLDGYQYRVYGYQVLCTGCLRISCRNYMSALNLSCSHNHQNKDMLSGAFSTHIFTSCIPPIVHQNSNQYKDMLSIEFLFQFLDLGSVRVGIQKLGRYGSTNKLIQIATNTKICH